MILRHGNKYHIHLWISTSKMIDYSRNKDLLVIYCLSLKQKYDRVWCFFILVLKENKETEMLKKVFVGICFASSQDGMKH